MAVRVGAEDPKVRPRWRQGPFLPVTVQGGDVVHFALVLGLWLHQAGSHAVGGWLWAYPAGVWLLWSGGHAVAAWALVRDEKGYT